MLIMAYVCEGTVHSEEISKLYLESVKTVKQVDAIHHQWSKSKHKGRGHGGHRSHSRSQSRKPGCSNCGSSHPPKKCKAYSKECFHCHKKGHFSELCCSKQHGKSPGSNVRSSSQNNRFSCRDVHEIDQSQFDDSVQFEQDSITIQFRTQVRHTNVMSDEISSTPLLQRLLTDVHVKPIGLNQSYWTKQRFKIDSRACGNLMPLSMYKSLYNCVPSGTTMNSAVHLLDYNKREIKQLGTCDVNVRFRSIVKHIHFYVVPDRLKPIIGVSDTLALGLNSFHCPIYTDWQCNSNFTHSVDFVHSNADSTVHTGTARGIVNFTTQEFTMDTLTKQAIINHPKYASFFSGIGHFRCSPVHITMRQNATPVKNLQEGGQLPCKTNSSKN